MNIEEFILHLSEQYEDIDTSEFIISTNFKDNDEYSSLVGMAIIAMVDEKYNVRLTGKEIKDANTIEDLFEVIQNKM